VVPAVIAVVLTAASLSVYLAERAQSQSQETMEDQSRVDRVDILFLAQKLDRRVGAAVQLA
jgi:hypothetical protein